MEFHQSFRLFDEYYKAIELHSRYLAKSVEVLPKHPISKAFYDLSAEQKVVYVGHCLKPIVKQIKVDGKDMIKLDCFKKPGLNTKALLKVAEPAPFGFGDKTVFDESVRKAFEIKADNLEVEYGSEYSKLNSVLKKLAPAGKTLAPKLYKLQMYTNGGFFKPHRDTLHAANHYATLLISLPSKYKGGEFLVRQHDGKEVKTTLTDGTSYVVFLTDLEHEVLPVKSGVRAVLQYDLYLEDDSEATGGPVIKRARVSAWSSDDEDEQNGEDGSGHDGEDDENQSDYSDDYYNYNTKFRYDYKKSKRSVYNYDEDRIGDDALKGIAKPIAPAASLTKPNTSSGPSAAERLLDLVENFRVKHPDEKLTFLLSHNYPVIATVDNLRASDRVLYETLSRKYEVGLGFALEHAVTDYEGMVETCKLKAILDHESFQAMMQYAQNETKPDIKHPKHFVFVGNGTAVKKVKQIEYLEYTSNEAQLGEFTYQAMALTISGPKKK